MYLICVRSEYFMIRNTLHLNCNQTGHLGSMDKLVFVYQPLMTVNWCISSYAVVVVVSVFKLGKTLKYT